MGIAAKGVDLSHHNGNVDFKALASSVDFVILKIGGSDKRGHTCYKDVAFEEYYRKAKEAGLKVGGYWFAGFEFTANNSLQDAEYLLNIIKGKQFEYPIFLDIEIQDKRDRFKTTQGCMNFLDYLEVKNYFVGIYGSDISTFKERLDIRYLLPYTWWVARYGKEPEYATKNLGIWQNSSTGRVYGVRGNVDTDISFIKYDDIIKKKHLNGF